MSPEETFRRVLAARLPAGPGWTAWIDGTVTELAGSVGAALTREEAHAVAIVLQQCTVPGDSHDASIRRMRLADRLDGR